MTDRLLELGLLDEEDIAIDLAALDIAAIDHPAIDLDPYAALLDAIEARLGDLDVSGDDIRAQARALARVMAGEYGLAGDRETYDDPANADLIAVLDRRRGLPVSLSILWVAAARRQGWAAQALDVPGHVLVLLGDAGTSIVVDPFRGGVTVDAAELTALAARGDGEAPAVRRIAAMPNRAILVRLLQNQASRAEAAGEDARALALYERMTRFAPDHGHAWWERARLELADHRVADARTSLSAILEVTRDPAFRGHVTRTLEALA